MSKFAAAYLTAFLFTMPYTAKAMTLDVTVDTSNLAGTTASLAFDLIDGDNAVNNALQVSNFVINGSGSFDNSLATLTGGASGGLDSLATLADSDFFNELFQPVVLGENLKFQLQLSDILETGALVPDRFDFFILDEFGAFSLFPTTDPTGSNSLFGIDLNGQGGVLSLYAAADQSSTWVVNAPLIVPLPGSIVLMATGLTLIARRAQRTT